MAATYMNHAVSSISGDVTPSALFLAPNMIDWTKKVRRTDAPLLTAIGRGKNLKPASVKLEWGWSYPDTDGDQLNGAISSTNATSFVVDDASKFQVGDIVLIESEKLGPLTTVDESTDTLTGARGYGGTTAATHVDNMSVIILPPAIAENQATPLSTMTQGEKDYNYFQQMEWSIQLSHRARVIPTQETLSLNIDDRTAAELRKKMEDTIPSRLENSLLFGSRSVGTTSVAGAMGGLLNTSSYVTTSNTSISGALTYGTLISNMQTVYNLVGNNMGRVIMAHPTICEIISSFFEDVRRGDLKSTSITTYFDTINTGWYGEVTLMPNYKMLKTAVNGSVALDKLVLFNPDDLELVSLSPDSDWSTEPLPEEGWFDKVAIRGDKTLRAQNPDTRLILGGFSTTRSDYPNLA